MIRRQEIQWRTRESWAASSEAVPIHRETPIDTVASGDARVAPEYFRSKKSLDAIESSPHLPDPSLDSH